LIMLKKFFLASLLFFIGSTIFVKASYDPCEVLPIDMRISVFSYLSERDLLTCGKVSSKWRQASSSDRIWRKIAESFYSHIAQIQIEFYFTQSVTAQQIRNGQFKLINDEDLKTDGLKLRPVYKYMMILRKVVLKEVQNKSLERWDADLELLLTPPRAKSWVRKSQALMSTP
jgi:hypothetical protein